MTDTGGSWAAFFSSIVVVAFSAFFATGVVARVALDCATVSSPSCSPAPYDVVSCLQNVLTGVAATLK